MEKQLSGRVHGRICLTNNTKKIFLEALKEGKTRHEIIIMLELEPDFGAKIYSKLLKEYMFSIKNKCSYLSEDKLRKTEPYYENEDDYGRIPIYKMSDFSEEEILFYDQMNIKNKMKKLDKFKIDTYLHLNATLMANLGTDSTDNEKAFIVELKQKNLNNIKEISPEFFDTIDDGEK